VPTLLVIGLGNPGQEYANSRHNLGFMVADELSRKLRIQFRPGRGDFWFARAVNNEMATVLVKPVTYMNRSGTAVVEALDQFAARPEDVIVVLDDFALPLGTLRIRPSGSDGGHNGLASVIYHLLTDEVVRVRCGIRREVMPPKESSADFVLAPFEPDEEVLVRPMVERAADAVLEVQRSGLERAMGIYNGPATPPGA